MSTLDAIRELASRHAAGDLTREEYIEQAMELGRSIVDDEDAAESPQPSAPPRARAILIGLAAKLAANPRLIRAIAAGVVEAIDHYTTSGVEEPRPGAEIPDPAYGRVH